jgi:hypothetical protein
MEKNNLGNTLSQENIFQILVKETKRLQAEHLWSNQQTLIDLLSQLLFHNLLVSSNDLISFWHSSFQDFFSAVYISSLPINKIKILADENLNDQTLAFLGGLLDDPTNYVEHLITKIHDAPTPAVPFRLIRVLEIMGNKFTHELIRAIAEPNFEEITYAVYQILESRNYKGKEIIDELFSLIATIDEINNGYLDLEDLDSFPDPARINYGVFTPLYKKLLYAVSKGDMELANNLYNKLFGYIKSLAEENIQFDTWIVTNNLEDLQVFSNSLKEGILNDNGLKEFCRNTINRSSLPYLEAILDTSKNNNLRMEANLAIHCIYRIWN